MPVNSIVHALRKRAALLLLLAFACGQFVEFTHQAEHSASDAAERCATCVQFDSFSVSPAASGPATVADFGPEAIWPARNGLVSVDATYRHPARAPPKS